MGRACTCKICKAKLNTDTAYKVIVKDKPCYYCSEFEYTEDLKKKAKVAADKDKVYKLICQIIGRTEIINSILWKEKAVWNSVKPDDVIGAYLEENKDYLTSVISRLENKEFNRIRYLSAIIKNNLGDFKPKVEEKRIVKTEDLSEMMYEIRHTNKNKRVSLEDLEDCL